MPAVFTLEVYTPYRLFFSGPVESISLTLLDGEIGVYAHHTPITAPVQSCILRFKDDKGITRAAFISNGFLEVSSHKTVLLVDTAEWPKEIDINRARAAKQNAEEILTMASLKFEINKAKEKLRRAEYRLKLAAQNG
ncbi:MAG: ATP synthase F1 subunit epsilon [Treponema sp.]|nr:ATP synthase F1 subunit epsilon [Treponema sp.]